MSRGTILVTGGAGYIGSHTCYALHKAGFEVVVCDNLRTGHQVFARFGPLEQGDVRDRARLAEVMARYKPDAVIHFAALIEAGISVRDPAEFYDVNVVGVLSLLDAARANGMPPIVFSSTCATYGTPQRERLDETHPQWPINPYGWTKFCAERALLDYQAAYGQRVTLLRYFNAAGAATEAGLGEKHDPETHAIPLAIFAVLGRRETFSLFGEDYPTRDGSCVRDYIHVLDLADAHVKAAERMLGGAEGEAFNLGTGNGATVKEIVAAIEKASGRTVPLVRAARRPGDPPALVANSEKAAQILGWRATRTLDEIIASAWVWHSETETALFG